MSSKARLLPLLLTGFVLAAAVSAGPTEVLPPLPERLEDTGLYVPGTRQVRPGILGYTPQYPLWSDAAAKRRWLYLPPGSSIDASDPDAWIFPPGTRLWKEFAHEGAVETRYIERLADGSWRFASYVWSIDGSEARLAPVEGIARLPVPAVPGGSYAVPSRDDCLACHEGNATPVIGVSALQLSPDRDPNAAHAETPRGDDVDLHDLHDRGLLLGLPTALLETPPRIEASSPVERSALGYLHANCGHCHNDGGPLALLEMVLSQGVAEPSRAREAVLASLVDRRSDFATAGTDVRVVPGRPHASVLALRMHSRNPVAQMPPLGTAAVDIDGVALVERWIREDLVSGEETLP